MTKHPLLGGHFGNSSVTQKLSCCDMYNRVMIYVFYFAALVVQGIYIFFLASVASLEPKCTYKKETQTVKPAGTWR